MNHNVSATSTNARGKLRKRKRKNSRYTAAVIPNSILAKVSCESVY